MSISITVNGVSYSVPASAVDTNWAAAQVLFEQALAAASTLALAGARMNAIGLVAYAPVAGTSIPIASTTGTVDCSTLAGNVTMTATPTLADGVNGQQVTIWNRHATRILTLQDEGTLPSSGLRLSANTLALVEGSSVTLRYNTADDKWYQTASAILI